MSEIVGIIAVALALGLAGDQFLMSLNRRRQRRDDLHVPSDWSRG